VQLAPKASVAVQSSVSANGVLAAMLLMFKDALPVLLKATSTGELVVETGTLGMVTLLALKDTVAADPVPYSAT
jgi:hypothetical protein